MDWSLFHSLNGALRHHDGAQDAAQVFNAWAIFVLVGIAGAIWFVARPGGSGRSKLAALSAAVAGAIALLLNLALGQLWYQNRPFVDHPAATLLLVGHGADNSFPSDHASLAFAVGSPSSPSTGSSGGRPYVSWGVRRLSRLSDPVVAGVRHRIAPARRS